jgi:hypothetical protein
MRKKGDLVTANQNVKFPGIPGESLTIQKAIKSKDGDHVYHCQNAEGTIKEILETELED